MFADARRRYLVPFALALGLLLAALPVLATRGRACAAPTAPENGAPVYVAFTSDARIHELRCAASGRVAFVPVRTLAEVDARLEEGAAGVIIDRDTYARLKRGQLRAWLIGGNGRAIIGLDLTASQLRADAGGVIPDDPALPSLYLGDAYVGHLSFRSIPGATCGGGGTTPYRGGVHAKALVERLLAWATPTGGCSFG